MSDRIFIDPDLPPGQMFGLGQTWTDKFARLVREPATLEPTMDPLDRKLAEFERRIAELERRIAELERADA